MKRHGARLGQHFLTGQWAARALAQAAHIKKGETVLEIGPGKGALTKELLATGGHVLAVEKDGVLVKQLGRTFAAEIASGALKIVPADIRDFSPEEHGLVRGGYALAANIPYYITGEIIRKFLETGATPRALALLVQKEVAERIIARDKKESILSISAKAYGKPRIVAKVSRGNFSPPPSVDSAILLIDNVSKDFFSGITEKEFFSVVRAGFSSKRKFLANNLGVKFGKARALEAIQSCGLNEKVRAEDAALDQWKSLANKLISPESAG
jgi:16S rRNA (adenine1518-N6/adenine1519-N6)-dimethyltransferase